MLLAMGCTAAHPLGPSLRAAFYIFYGRLFGVAEHLSQDWKTSDETWVTGHDKQDAGIHPPRSMRLSEGVTSVDVIKHGRVVVIVASAESWAE
jgi:hypothetical protein